MDVVCQINWKENSELNLSVQDGKLAIVNALPWDPSQIWFKKVFVWNKIFHDQERKDAYVLINKLTQLAMCIDGDKLTLALYDPLNVNESLLWTKSPQAEDQHGVLRPYSNIKLTVEVGEDIFVSSVPNVSDLRLWKFTTPGSTPLFRIFSKGSDVICMSHRGDKTVMAPFNEFNESQLWIKSEEAYKDANGNPAFALVNKASLKAIKHSNMSSVTKDEVVFKDYVNGDTSILWVDLPSKNFTGYQNITCIDNQNLIVDVKADVWADDTTVILFPPKEESKQANQLWKYVPAAVNESIIDYSI